MDGDETPKNVLLSWLQLAAYGGDAHNLDYLPLRMLGKTTRNALKNYENDTFSFEDVPEGTYKRNTVMFIVDRKSGEKVAVNGTPYG